MLALLVAAPLAGLLGTPALAARKVDWAGFEARLTEFSTSELGIVVQVEVRDICAVHLRKELVEITCSPWRQLVPLDESQELSFEGEITLADGRVRKVSFEGVQRDNANLLIKVDLADGKGRPEPVLWRPEDGGLWYLDGKAAGTQLLLDESMSTFEQRFSALGNYRRGDLTGQLRWRDEAGELSYEAPVVVPPEQMTAHTIGWMCRAYEEEVWAEDVLRVHGIAGGARLLAELKGPCREKIEFSTPDFCTGHSALLPDLTRLDPEGREQVLLSLQALVDLCDAGTTRTLGDAAVEGVAARLVEAGPQAAHEAIDALSPTLGFGWADRAGTSVSEYLESEYQAAFAAGDLEVARAALNEAAWIRTAQDGWLAIAWPEWLAERFRRALEGGDLATLSAAAEARAEWGAWMPGPWLAEARATREQVLAEAGRVHDVLHSAWQRQELTDNDSALLEAACERGWQVACIVPSELEDAGTQLLPAVQERCRADETMACVVAAWLGAPEPLDALAGACDAGLVAACTQAAELATNAGQPDRAAGLWERACSGDVPEGCAFAGLGRLAQGNEDGAARILGQACDLGNIHGCYWRASTLRAQAAAGREVDSSEVIDLHSRACEAGLADACADLAGMYWRADLVDRDPGRAERLATDSCKCGSDQGCFVEAIVQATPREHGGKGRPDKALARLEALCSRQPEHLACALADSLRGGGPLTGPLELERYAPLPTLDSRVAGDGSAASE